VDLTPPHAYAALMKFGRPNLRDAVFTGHRQGFSSPQSEGARASVLRRLLQQGHYESHLDADDWQRLVTWMDTYAQRSGSFSTEQTAQLEVLRERLGGLLTP
jgi:hypothetical protein